MWPLQRGLQGHGVDGRPGARGGTCTLAFSSGEGDGQTERILKDLVETGYAGHISIEPHVAVVFHGAGAADELSPEAKAKLQYDSYLKYGRMLDAMLRRLGAPLA